MAWREEGEGWRVYNRARTLSKHARCNKGDLSQEGQKCQKVGWYYGSRFNPVLVRISHESTVSKLGEMEGCAPVNQWIFLNLLFLFHFHPTLPCRSRVLASMVQ